MIGGWEGNRLLFGCGVIGKIIFLIFIFLFFLSVVVVVDFYFIDFFFPLSLSLSFLAILRMML